MGTDKALLCLPSGGPTLVERVVGAARAVGVDDVLVVAGDAARLPVMDARFVMDERPGAGPLAGLVAGLDAMRHDATFVFACDLPYLSVPLLQWMMALPREEWDACVPLLPGDDDKEGWQPLHAIYRRSCLAPIRAALALGERRMTAFFPSIRVRALTVDDMRPYDPALHSTCSANTPDAWDKAARWLAGRGSEVRSG